RCDAHLMADFAAPPGSRGKTNREVLPVVTQEEKTIQPSKAIAVSKIDGRLRPILDVGLHIGFRLNCNSEWNLHHLSKFVIEVFRKQSPSSQFLITKSPLQGTDGFFGCISPSTQPLTVDLEAHATTFPGLPKHPKKDKLTNSEGRRRIH
ncbi:MAG TPA: hypothetical protein VLS90_19870, partial [Thermodesulfobacteriota bacterium]|nr:hypothetical protein [Thermodesulfobacteriota bacterium]